MFRVEKRRVLSRCVDNHLACPHNITLGIILYISVAGNLSSCASDASRFFPRLPAARLFHVCNLHLLVITDRTVITELISNIKPGRKNEKPKTLWDSAIIHLSLTNPLIYNFYVCELLFFVKIFIKTIAILGCINRCIDLNCPISLMWRDERSNYKVRN